jgi:hypothetical protein
MELNPPIRTERELKYELQMGHLIAIVIIGILLAMLAGYWVGKEVGFSRGTSTLEIEKPAYCSVDKFPDKIKVSCNELGNVSLDSLCKFGSADLKEKIRIVIIGSG